MMSQYARNALMPPRNLVAPSKQQEPRGRRNRSSAAAAVAATRRLAPALPSIAHSLPTSKVVVQRNTTEPELSQLSSDTFSAVSYSTPSVEAVPMPRTGTGIIASVRDKQRSRYSTSTAQPYSFHSSSGSTLTSRTSKEPWALPQLLVDPSFGSRRLPSSEANTESGTLQGSRSIQTAPNSSSSSSLASSRRTGGLNSIPLCQESVASSGASVSRRDTRTMEMNHHTHGTPMSLGRADNSASSSRFSHTSRSREGTTGQSILSYPSSRRLATSSQSSVASASASSTNRPQLPGTPRRPSSIEYQIQLAVQSQLQQTLEKHEQELMQKFAAQFGSTTENSVNQEQLDQFIQEQRICMQEQLEMERRKLEQVLQTRLAEYERVHAQERQEHKSRLEQQHASHLQEIQSVLTHVQELAHAQDQANQDHLGQMTQIQAQVKTHANKATGLLDRAEAAADKITDMVDSALASLPSMVQSIANKFLTSKNQESDKNLTPETNKSSKSNAEISKKRSSKDHGRKPVDHSQTNRIITFSQGSPSSSVTTASKKRRQRRISPPSQTSLRIDDQPSVPLTQENSPVPSSSAARTPARRTKKRSVVSSTKSSTKHSKKKKTSSFAPLELLDTTNLSCVTPKAATPQTPRAPSFVPKVSHSVRSKRPTAASRSRRRQGDGGQNDPVTVSSNDTKRRRHKKTRRPVSKKPPHVVQNDFSFLSDLSD